MNLLQFPSFSFPNPWNHEMVSKKEVYFTEGCESEQQLADYFTIKKKNKQLKNQINCFQASYTSTVVFKEN